MTVEQTGVIDRIAIAPDGTATLFIFDHLPWEPFGPHHELLVAKLNSYLAFVMDGQISQDYPEAGGRELAIRILCKHRPSEAALVFFARVTPQVEAGNVRLDYGPALGLGYEHES